MSVKFHHHHCFLSPSTSAQRVAQKSSRVQYLYRVTDLDHTWTDYADSGKKISKCTEYRGAIHSFSCRYLRVQKHNLFAYKSKRARVLFPSAASDDGVAVNGSSDANMSRDVEAMRFRLNQALQNEDYNDGLLQSLYDAARVFELSIKERNPRMSWFSAAWLGVDKNAWIKSLSYQASVYALLLAANEVSMCGDGRNKDVNVVVQRSLLRMCAPLESVIREKLSGKQHEDFEWFWSEQIPVVVTTFVNHFERDPRFKAAAKSGNRMALNSGNAGDISLVLLSLVCIAMTTKLGPAKVSCAQLFSMIPDVTGGLMDVLVSLVPIHEAYHAVKEIGLLREFLVHVGPRAASCGVSDDCMTDEMVFWVDLVQKQLQRALDKEKIWSRVTTSESIEVLEKDLAVFGFFVALGRSTRSFLAANGFDKIGEPIEGFVRYLVGGCVLYYPQLAPISSYELYVEVVCEELDWLPFYPGSCNTAKKTHGHNSKSEGPPNAEAVAQALDVCLRWFGIFIKHSRWLENPSNVKAAKFLSRGHAKLLECKEELGLQKSDFVGSFSLQSSGTAAANPRVQARQESDSFEKALESVEEALGKMENLLQEMHVSSSDSGKEQLKAACSDLEKIRKLKKEAEFLEASFRAKAAFLKEENDDGEFLSTDEQGTLTNDQDRAASSDQKKNSGNPRGFWTFLASAPMKKSAPGSSESSDVDTSAGISDTSSAIDQSSDANEIRRFELLRSELVELEKRVQKSTTLSENDEEMELPNAVRATELVRVQKDENFIEKSLEKLKETSTDVWQGTQLLGIDVAAATGLLRRSIIGDELTEKERKFLRRTLTDLASVVPIGVLMLLPVTAVGHAAMLAAIQRYVPSLIPSTYGSERLDLLRQLDKMKQTDTSDTKTSENVEELA